MRGHGISKPWFTNPVARPRRDSDDALLDRLAVAIAARQTVTPWTLAEVAPSVGLSAAGIVKRFGSRQGVLLALSHRWIAAIPKTPNGDLPPVEELRGWVAGRFAPPHGNAQGLSQLTDDLVDEDLCRLLAEGWGLEQAYLKSLLGRCDLPGVKDPDASAAILFDALNGAALRAVTEGSAAAVFQTLDNLLEQWT